MSRYEHDPLMNELLAGEEMRGFRAASLEQMLSLARRRRRQRHVARVLVWTVAPVLLAAGLVFQYWPSPSSAPDRKAQYTPIQETAPSSPQPSMRMVKTGGVRYLTDDELLTMFPGRRVALIGRPGEQKLVFLDQPRASAP